MSNVRLVNWEPGDSVATGLYRPKTTALLFDKIWVPNSLRFSELGQALGFPSIPKMLCVFEEDCFPSALEQMDTAARVFLLGNSSSGKTAYSTYLLNAASHDTLHSLFELQRTARIHQDFAIANFPSPTMTSNDDFLFSTSRNEGIRNVVKRFHDAYGLELTPVFFRPTAFEQALQRKDLLTIQTILKEHGLQYFAPEMLLFQKLGGDFTLPQQPEHPNVFEICLDHIPIAIEEKLEWEQVCELRQDQSSVKRLRSFRNWSYTALQGKSEAEIHAALEKSLNDYKFALKKHGIETAVGGLTTLMSAGATAVQALHGDFAMQLAAGVGISSSLLKFTVTKANEYLTHRREPIAMLYELEKLADK